MLGQLTGEDEADRGLDLSGGDGGLLVVGGELGGLSGNALEDVCRGKLETESRNAPYVGSKRQNIPFTKEFRMDMARVEIPVSGWTCLRTGDGNHKSDTRRVKTENIQSGSKNSPL